MLETKVETPTLITTVGLTKLFLWPEAERIQTYPEAFANLKPDRVYSRREIATEIFDLIYKEGESNKPVRGHQLENCFGLEIISAEKIALRGINALRQVGPNQFVATESALQIGQGYRAKEDEDAWVIPLAQQVACFEVRTRLLLYLLGQGGWSLNFVAPEFYAFPSVRATVVREGEVIGLFQNDGEVFNRLLYEHRHVAFGPWWAAELAERGCEVDEAFHFEGIRGGTPSTNKLNSNLKSSLFLLKYLGVLEGSYGGWVVNADKMVNLLGQAIACDFVELPEATTDQSPLSILKHLANQLQDETGLIVVNDLARSWAGRNNIPPHEVEVAFDQFMRQQLYEGTVHVTFRHQGQPRHGRGLFGDENARKIKLEFSR